MRANLKVIGGLTGFKVLGAALGILYMIFQVRYFGTSRVIEIFFAAQSVVYVIISLTQSGQLTEIYLPEYLKLKNRISDKVAHQSYAVVSNRLSLFIVTLLIAGFWLAPYLMKLFIPGFSEPSQQEATLLFRAFLPLIFLQIHSAFLTTVLNAEKVFGRTEVASIINHLLALAILILLYDTLGVWVLVLSSYVGILLQILLSLFYAGKAGIKYYWVWSIPDFDHKSFFRTTFYTFFYTLSTQLLNWAMVASISFLPQGVLAIFKYVEKLVPKVNSILIQPFSTVFFTSISAKVSSQVNPETLKKEIVKLQEFALLFGILIFTLAVASGKEMLSMLWGSEKFSVTDLSLAYQVFVSFFLALAFSLYYTINRKYSVALGFARYNYTFQGFSQFFSAILSFLLIYYLAVPGLLISILLNRIFLIYIPVYVNSVKGPEFYASPKKSFLIRFFIVIAALPIAIAVMKHYVAIFDDFGVSRWIDFTQSILWGIVGSIFYLIFIHVVKHNFFSSIKREIFNNV